MQDKLYIPAGNETRARHRDAGDLTAAFDRGGREATDVRALAPDAA